MSAISPQGPFAPRRSVGARLSGLLAVLAAVAFMASMVTILVAIAIWPGEAKLTAPLFCDDAHPDAFVVSDTYNPAPGETTINYTMYCMGPRGETTEIGFFKPFLALTAGHGVALIGLGLVTERLGGRGRIGRRRPPPIQDVIDDGPTDAASPQWPS